MNTGYRTAPGRPMSRAAVDPIRGKPPRFARSRPTRTVGAAAAICLLSASGMPASAEPLTFDEALALAETTAPQLRASALGVEAASAASAAAGRLPDPQLRFGIDNLPVSGPMAGRFGDDEMTMARIGLMQEVPSGARRRAERAVAEADIDVAVAGDAVARREARIAVGLAWIDLHYIGRRLAAIEEVLSTLEPLWEAAPAGVVSGADRPAGALTPVLLRAALEDRRSMLIADETRARGELTRWTGDPDPAASGPAPDLEVEPAVLRIGLERLPALQAWRAAGSRADAEVDLARSGRRPDWSFEVSYGRRDPVFGDMLSVGASVSLPLFANQRQEPLIAARSADALGVRLEREAAAREIRAALDAALADLAARRDQWVRSRDVILPAARQRADLETASYAAGRAGLTEVLEVFTAMADARLDALDREAALARDTVRITLTYRSDDR
jgi:outer membrane protein, heavy metal efflux system